MRFLRDRATLWALWRWIMIILLKKDLSDRERLNVIEKIKGLGLDFSIGEGNGFSTVSLLGDVSHIDGEGFMTLSGVMGVVPVSTRTPLATAAEGGGFFGGELQIIAGPCAVEGDGIFDLARAVKDCDVSMLRGGAYKPRTSPYSFAGLKREGIDLLVRAGREVGLPVVSELMGVRDIEDFADVDVIQIGARIQKYIEKNGRTLSNYVGLQPSEILEISKEVYPELSDMFASYGLTIVKESSAGSILQGLIVEKIVRE